VTFEAFREGLRASGYSEGRDIVIETRFTEGRNDRFPALIAELLESKVDVLLAGSPQGAIAAIKADTTTPIVIAGVSDPAGLAKSLGRPAGHITGTSLLTHYQGGKWVEMLKEATPEVTRVAVLLNPQHPSRDRWQQDIGEQARAMKVHVTIHDAHDLSTLEKALAAIEAGDAQGLIVTGDPAFVINRDKVIALAERRRLPAVYFSKLFADSGGLIAYGGSLEDSYRKSPAYIARILKGAKPGDLPIEPASIELVVNRKAAKAIGLTLPESLVLRADKVID
jgi:putative ABC transport system substrate-binding protein